MPAKKSDFMTHGQMVSLLQKMAEHQLNFTHVETLCYFDGKAGYTVAEEEQ